MIRPYNRLGGKEQGSALQVAHLGATTPTDAHEGVGGRLIRLLNGSTRLLAEKHHVRGFKTYN